jgi:photosystem II stability/assembly factor-like uncharacterized protein
MSAIALDPLIAEAKQRARRRRLVALALVVVAAAAPIATLGTRTWSQTPSSTTPVSTRLVPISWFGSNHGMTWAVMNHSVWLTPDDGGTWRHVGVPGLSADWWVREVQFVDRLHGWLTADSGSQVVFARTTNGGRTWITSVLPAEYGLPAWSGPTMYFSSAQRGYFVAGSPSGAHLFGTSDGGAHWVRISRVRAPFQWGSVEAAHGRDMWVVGGGGVWTDPHKAVLHGRLFHSRDGGRTWHRVRLRDQGSVRYFASVGGRLVAAGFTRRAGALGVYVSSDGGTHWMLRTGGRSIEMDILAQFTFSVASPDLWFAASTVNGHLFATTDAGRHWRAVFTPPARNAFAHPAEIEFTSPRVGWATLFSKLVRTTDGGRHWTPAGPREPKKAHKRG